MLVYLTTLLSTVPAVVPGRVLLTPMLFCCTAVISQRDGLLASSKINDPNIWLDKNGNIREQEQGWRRGESNRLLPIWPGFDSLTRRYTWVEFVGSLLCSERFFSSDTAVFPSPQKPTFDLL